MTRELLIFRHGKSDWDTGVDDFHRPLKDRGKRAAQRVGAWLAQHDMVPDLIITSPAERALVTAQKACKAMGNSDEAIVRDERIYAAGLDELLQVLEDCPQDADRVMLTGHNPGLEELLVWLANDEVPLPDDGKLLPTATLARLQMPADWRALVAGCARLLSITRPATLPKKFPYPAPDGSEQRDRPAYYYTQSAVIPYRVRDGKLEILVIASSKKNHLVVPKGIQEPGLTPRASAAREALEEAGIEGEVAAAALGSYSCEKWGATCTVAVYPMKVTRIIAEQDWEESHRGRKWMSPAKAAGRLKQAELGPLVKKLESMF
ncbi:MAG: histidine phosphatase family protein [Gammaproteobacteria bacterium]